MRIKIGKKILAKNEDFAAANRKFFKKKKLFCINMISSPGSGKTTILEQTAKALKDKIKIGVIEGDLYTEFDAKRILATGIPAGTSIRSWTSFRGSSRLRRSRTLNRSQKSNVDSMRCGHSTRTT